MAALPNRPLVLAQAATNRRRIQSDVASGQLSAALADQIAPGWRGSTAAEVTLDPGLLQKLGGGEYSRRTLGITTGTGTGTDIPLLSDTTENRNLVGYNYGNVPSPVLGSPQGSTSPRSISPRPAAPIPGFLGIPELPDIPGVPGTSPLPSVPHTPPGATSPSAFAQFPYERQQPIPAPNTQADRPFLPGVRRTQAGFDHPFSIWSGVGSVDVSGSPTGIGNPLAQRSQSNLLGQRLGSVQTGLRDIEGTGRTELAAEQSLQSGRSSELQRLNTFNRSNRLDRNTLLERFRRINR